MAKKRHLLYLDIEHENTLKEIVEKKNLSELDTVSQIVRFIILDYYQLLEKGSDPDVRLNAMSKELSITLNLVTSLVQEADAAQVRNEDVLQFHLAEKYVEQTINEKKKWKNKKGEKPKKDEWIEEALSEKTYDPEIIKEAEKQKESSRLSKYLDRFEG